MIKSKLGQSLLEVVLAAAIIAVGLIAALALINNSQKSASFSRDTNVAGDYSYQVVDWARDLRNTMGWATFVYYLEVDGPSPVTYCFGSTALPDNATAFDDLSPGGCNGDQIPDTIFTREVTFTFDNPPTSTVSGTVTTSWKDSGNTRTNTLDFNLNEW